MPRLTVYMVRTSLLHLGIGFSAGMLILFNKGVPFAPNAWRLLPLHVEMVLFGWTMQLAMGVAFWVLPRFSTAPRYGNERLGWLAYILFNAGLGTYIAGALVDIEVLLLLGRVFEFAAVVCFARMIWSRVKALSLSTG